MRGSLRLTLATGATLATLLIGATGLTVLADENPSRGNGHGPRVSHSEERERNDVKTSNRMEESDDISGDLVTTTVRPTGEARPDTRECPTTAEEVEDFEFKNHGHYVSCVARGFTEAEGDSHGEMVSGAAESDIGKDEDDDGDEEESED